MSSRILPALVLTGLISGCGGGPHLEGSVTPLLNLHYDTSEAVADTNDVSVRFLTSQGTGENTILKVTASLENLELKAHQEINLAELLGEDPDSPQRGVVSRSVLDEPSRDFPRILLGGLTFEKSLDAFTSCAKVAGDFHVTFVNGTDVYSGRTVFGHFDATVPTGTDEKCP